MIRTVSEMSAARPENGSMRLTGSQTLALNHDHGGRDERQQVGAGGYRPAVRSTASEGRGSVPGSTSHSR